MAILRVVVPMPPGLVAINRRDTVVHVTTKKGRQAHVIRKRKAYRLAEDELILAVRQEVVRRRWGWCAPGLVAHVLVHSWWPGLAGDVDAVNKAALDALTAGGAYHDDSEVEVEVLRRTWGSNAPRIELAVTTTLSELIELLGWQG